MVRSTAPRYVAPRGCVERGSLRIQSSRELRSLWWLSLQGLVQLEARSGVVQHLHRSPVEPHAEEPHQNPRGSVMNKPYSVPEARCVKCKKILNGAVNVSHE